MFRRTMLAGLFAVVASSGCGSDSTAPVNVACKITFSGALGTVHDCSTQVAANYTTANDSSVVSGGVQGTPALAVNIQYKGIPQVGTYKHSDALAHGFVSASSGSQGWIAATPGFGTAATGSWTINLTSVTDSATVASGKVFKLHGTVDATMTPFGGGTSLTVQVTF